MMTRDDYRKIKVALSKPHTLKAMSYARHSLVLSVYYTCVDLADYYNFTNSTYEKPIDFLNEVVFPYRVYDEDEGVFL